MSKDETLSDTVALPRLVIFEGVDGCGKTTLGRLLASYYASVAPALSLYHGAFPGNHPGTLGEWVYRLHHNRVTDAPAPAMIAPPALQLLHVAAHVDAIQSRLTPVFNRGGAVILDRYWWSTYAYVRRHLSPNLAWPLVDAERPFWHDLPAPVIIYLTRQRSLKAHELEPEAHVTLDAAYHELIVAERRRGVCIRELSNDGLLSGTWADLLNALAVPFQPMKETT